MGARDGKYGDDSDRGLELDDADEEMSLGWQNEGQQGLLHASYDDREYQCEDDGADTYNDN